jgi:hypothetical protein
MRRATFKLLLVAVLIAGLTFAIGHAENDSNWLVVWFLLLIFLGVPMALLSIRDLLVGVFSQRSASFRAWLILHVCAAFAAAIGFGLAHLAAVSGHPKAALHQWLVLVLPALAYLAPVFLAIHSGNLEFLALLAKPFRKRPRE